jgi:hypothetical protein
MKKIQEVPKFKNGEWHWQEIIGGTWVWEKSHTHPITGAYTPEEHWEIQEILEAQFDELEEFV